jgi:pyruvate formate lyase activating enzyme
MHEAQFWEEKNHGFVQCYLCRFHCRIADGGRGICGVRKNQKGTLYTLVYGRAVATNIDPIEKKPLFHLLPGSKSYSIATVGCNFRCLHCQNDTISQWPHEHSHAQLPGELLPPEQIIQEALDSGCQSIAYTYTEPTIYYEYAYDTAKLAHEAGLKNVFVSNGYTETKPLEEIAPFLDAANIDLKGFSDPFYKKCTGASLSGVLATLRDYRRLGIWLEVTTLLIPGQNDDAVELQNLAEFIVAELGAETPWHVTGFFPAYKMLDTPPTPMAALLRARAIGKEAGLKHVYTGNLYDADGESTYCPACHVRVVHREGFMLTENRIKQGRCEVCQADIAGVWA